MFLTPDELVLLTQKRRPSWQAKQLDFIGIPYRRRQDGTLIVLRVHVEGMQHEPPKREPRLNLA